MLNIISYWSLLQYAAGVVSGAVLPRYSDNQRRLISSSAGHSAQSTERWAAYVRDLYQRHIVAAVFQSTHLMADIFRKALPEEAFKRFRATIMVTAEGLRVSPRFPLLRHGRYLTPRRCECSPPSGATVVPRGRPRDTKRNKAQEHWPYVPGNECIVSLWR